MTRSIQFLILLPLLTSAIFAQGINGALTGVVTDPSGAVLIGAEVRARGAETGVETSARTNQSGVYNLPSIPIGGYEIRFDSPGFKRQIRSGIVVETAQVVRVDAVMEIGTAQDSVTVQAEAPLLQRETSGMGTEVSADMVRVLPFQLGGSQRNPFDLARLTPGASGSSNAANGIIIAGGRQYASEVFLDGVPVSYSARQNVAGPTAPSVETLAEFRVESVLPPAEYGRTSGGVVLAATRSGGNQLHGNVFGLFQNGVLAARRFNAAAADITRQGEFGVSLGGPVTVPKLYNGKNRTFFFANYTGFRYLTEVLGQSATVPTAAMRAGDFSQNTQRIYDPLTGGTSGQRLQFPGNIIPANRLSALAKKTQDIYPLPNAPGFANNYLGSSPGTNNNDGEFARIDHAASDKHRLSGNYRRNYATSTSVQGLMPFVSDGQTQTNVTTSVTFADDLIFKPNLVNRVQVGYNRFNSVIVNSPDIGLQVPGSYAEGFPQAVFASQGIATLGRNAARNPLFQNASLEDSVAWTQGKHNMKFGWRYDWYLQDQTNLGNREGGYTYSQFATSLPNVAGTGHAYASFMLGLVNNASMANNIPTPVRSHYGAVYAQDDWKISRRLTLNYGLRWEEQTPFYEIQGRISMMDTKTPNPGAGGLPGAVIFAGDGPGRLGGKRFMKPYPYAFGPRFGFAYQLGPNTVVRAGAGLFYQPLVQGDIRVSFTGWSASPALSTQDGGLTPVFQLDQGWPAGSVKTPPFIDPTISNNTNANTAEIRTGASGRMPRTSQWQFGLQHTVHNILLDVGYVGTVAHGVTNGALVNMNQLPVSALALGTLLTRNIADPLVKAAGYAPPYAGFNGTLAQALRAFPQYQTITDNDSPTGNSTYHALLLKAEKRFSNGLQFLASYSYSKQISDMNMLLDVDLPSPQDQYNRRLEKSLGNNQIPQRAILSYSYELPFGKGKPFLKSGLMAAVAGGWSVAAIQSYSAGDVLRITIPNNLPIFGGALRPNLVPGAPIYVSPGRGSFQPLNAATGQLGDFYLNKSAFATPAPFTLGSAPVYLPNVSGPGNANEQISAFRRFTAFERFRMELRADFFNAFNRRNLNDPVTDLTNPNFGRITGQGAPRTIQIGFRTEW